MTKTLRRATLGALLVLAAVPGMASAALTPGVSLSPVQAGCYPKGPLAIPNQAFGGIPAGQAQYKIAAVVNGQETAPCAALPSGAATNYGTFLQWAAAPGATAYRIYRNDSRIQELTPSNALCPTANAGARCQFIDSTGQPAAGVTGAPRALPTGVTQAGASPDLNIVQTFDYGGAGNAAGDDPAPNGQANSASLKDNLLRFPPGLLANPTAATTCTIAQLIGNPSTTTGGAGTTDAGEDKCPRASQVGTVLAQIQSPPVVPQNPPTPTVGDIYLGEKLATDGNAVTARLFVALRPPCSAGYPAPLNPGGGACIQRFTQAGLPAQAAASAEVEKSFLSAKATIVRRNPATAASISIDNETTSVAEGEDRDLAAVSNVRLGNGGIASSLPIQVRSLTQTLFGTADQGTAATTDDKPFVILPTSCDAKTFSVDAASYLDPALASANTAFQATGCGAVPFSPEVSATLDTANGQAGSNRNPSLTVRIAQSSDEAATKSASVTLPSGLGANIAALDRVCTVEQQNSAAGCPASSAVGVATATTPVLPGTLTGPVYAAINNSPYNVSGLPKLIVDLNGAARITFEGTIGFDATNTRLVNAFLDLPEVTLNTFSLSIAGGTGGLLQTTRDICDTPLGNLDAAFAGYNGGTATQSVALVSNQAYYCVPDVDPPGGGKKKAGLSLKVKPKTDKRKPFKFTATGKVNRKGTARGAGCKGNVKITVKKGKKTLDKATAKVKGNCSYKAKIKLSKKAGKKGKAVVSARFNGNSVLKKSNTVKKSVKYGAKKGGKKKGGKKGNK